MRVLLTCGGTAGHINPAIAVARMVLERRPGSEALFVGATGAMETQLVPREGFNIETVTIGSFARGFKPSAIKHNFKVARMRRTALKRAREIIEKFRPDVVVGTGGFASYPAVAAAQKMGIPTAIHESNVKPGLTTSVLAKKANKIMVGFAEAAAHYKNPERTVVTGTPVREEFIYTKREDARKRMGISPDEKLVVSYWGSLGAREMNKCIARVMKMECCDGGKFRHIHSTGSFGWKWMPDFVRELGVDIENHPAIDMREYIYDMPDATVAADLMVCRGGASTLGEIVAAAKPAIIIPSPNVAENHQEPNARALEDAGGAVVIVEKDCTPERLYATINELLEDRERLERMSDALRGRAVLDATERIYEVVRTLADEK